MTHEWNKLSGSVLGKGYLLGEFVSEHEHSATFRTTLPGDDRSLIAEIISSNAATVSFQRNSWSLASGLVHPLLLRIYDTGEESLSQGMFIYAVKEPTDECLANILTTRALSVEEAHKVVESVLLLLDYLHAKSLVHGAVRTSSIMAVGGQVKLAADTISTARRSGSTAQDMYGLGTSILEVLTPQGLRPTASELALAETHAAVTALPSPFREIAGGCLQPDEARRWTAARALKALSGAGYAATRDLGPKRRHLLGASVAIGTVVCAVALIWIAQRPAHSVKRAYDPMNDDRPSPIRQRGSADRTSITNTQSGRESALPALVSNESGGESNWGVIVATYKDYDLAQHFADSVSERWKEFRSIVYPPRGQAQKYYYVVIGSALSQDAAQQLHERAIAAGLKGYVTKVSSSPGVPLRGQRQSTTSNEF